MLAPVLNTTKLMAWLGRYPLANLVFAWLIIRTILWTVAVTLGHPNAQIDMIEWGSWGGVTPWGYPKHPPLPGWLAGALLDLAPGQVWGLYLGGYVCSALCLLCAFQLARQFMPLPRAALAALALDGLPYLANDPSDFSNNVVLNLFWSFTGLSIYKAIQTRTLGWWVAVGVSVGLAILTKYTIGVLLLPLALFALKNARSIFQHSGVYLSVLVALAIASPHLVWLIQNDFITVKYMSERSVAASSIWSHITNPLAFVLGQSIMLGPVVFILWPSLGRWQPPEDTMKRQFLHACVLGPVSVFLLISLITGNQLRMIWATPLWMFAGVWLLANFPQVENLASQRKTLLRWLLLVVGLMAFAVGYQKVEPYITGKAGRTLYPGKAITNEIEKLWKDRYAEPYAIVGGEPWLAGNVCCNSPHHPALYSSGQMGYFVMEAKHTPWTNDEDLKRRGGVLVWDANVGHEHTLQQIRERFPQAEVLDVKEFAYQTGANVPPARVGIAFVGKGSQ